MSFMSDAREGLGGLRVMASALTALGSVQAACRARADYERLASMTDEQLAALGLTRDRIAEHVMAKHF